MKTNVIWKNEQEKGKAKFYEKILLKVALVDFSTIILELHTAISFEECCQL